MADMREEAAIRVVDDEASVRHSWEFILESAGWTVRSYASAEAFLKLDDAYSGVRRARRADAGNERD